MADKIRSRGPFRAVIASLKDGVWAGDPNDGRWLLNRLQSAAVMLHESVEVDPEKRGGVPVLRGTRLTLAQLLAEIADGRHVVEIASDFEIDLEMAKRFLEGLSLSLDRPFDR